MYFELVRVYLATFVNDISLMNFSVVPHGYLYMLQCDFVVRSGLIVPDRFL